MPTYGHTLLCIKQEHNSNLFLRLGWYTRYDFECAQLFIPEFLRKVAEHLFETSSLLNYFSEQYFAGQ